MPSYFLANLAYIIRYNIYIMCVHTHTHTHTHTHIAYIYV